jgi:hypothetical protein
MLNPQIGFELLPTPGGVPERREESGLEPPDGMRFTSLQISPTSRRATRRLQRLQDSQRRRA